MQDSIYTTGEFAKLCGTTKDTLFLYDKKGLLKPLINAENGYRYYSGEQYATFLAIKSLKMAGLSLSEIAMALEEKDGKKLVSTLENNRLALAQRQMELYNMQDVTNRLLSSSTEFYSREAGFSLRRCPEEYIIALPSAGKSLGSPFWERLSDLDSYIEGRGYGRNALSNCSIIKNEFFMRGDYFPAYYGRKLDVRVTDPSLHIKPAGSYASMFFCRPRDGIISAFSDFRNELASRGLHPLGDCYFEIVTFSLLVDQEENQMFSISARTEQ
ncbi:MAG: MerR family transcriptional regulator [Oscillospiraceae bacterium]